MERLRVINVLLWTWNWDWNPFSCPQDPSLPFDACINYLGRVEVGQSSYEIVVGPNCIAQGLIVMLPYYSFICVLLRCLLLFCSVRTSSFLLCSPQHVEISLVPTNQCHDVIHVGKIHCDTSTFPFELVKHDVKEVDPLL